jgi:hypothetical protein
MTTAYLFELRCGIWAERLLVIAASKAEAIAMAEVWAARLGLVVAPVKDENA